MRKLKRIAGFLFIGVFLFPQAMITEVKASENNDVKIGDKYDKKIVVIDEDDEYTNFHEITNELYTKQKFFSGIFDIENNESNKKTQELLIPKTSENYEIAIAYEDGSYTYAGSADTYDEAVKKAETEDEKLKTITNDFVVPVVLDTAQQTIQYASRAIGRYCKVYKGEYDSYRTCFIFADENLQSTDRAIHDTYCSEMPLLEQKNGAAKICINGCIGWMNTDINRCANNENGRCSSDVLIQPVNQVTNPSFYYADDKGLIYHYISGKMDDGEVKIGSYKAENEAKKIGKAPSYLEKNVKYLSYDGMHFYSTKNRGIPETLCVLTEDLKKGNFNNSVNPSDPYYNYYLYLPFRSRTNYTAKDLNKYIDYYIDEMITTKPNYSYSKLKGIGDVLIKNQNKYGVNALLTLSIAINESDGGASSDALNKNNLFGLNATDYNTDHNIAVYDSVDDCIEDFCKNYISRGFADVTNYTFYGDFLGNKGYGANVKYATDPYWADKAANSACKIENYLSNKDINKYKDYDYYQLFKFTKSGDVRDCDNNIMYKVNDKFIPCSGEFAGATGILLCKDTLNLNGTLYNEIALDRTLQSNSKNNGSYKWSKKGFVNNNSIQLINKGKTNTDKADVDKDGCVDELDLAKAASLYNVYGDDFDYMCDLNNDGIVDIYDIVKISSQLNM